MKSFSEFVNETTVVPTGYSEMGVTMLSGLKRTYLRDKGATTLLDSVPKGIVIKPKQADVVGWFSNKYNPAFGWVVTRLQSYDKKWLGNSKDVFRVFTDKGTSIVKFNLKTGTYAFLDNEYYENTDKVRFDRMTPFKKFVVDTPEILFKDFGFKLGV